MIRYLSLLAILCLGVTAFAEQGQSAFKAYGSLPREAALHLAKIAACEGSPQPERWHFIVQDSAAEDGLRDYVVADGRLAAVNGVSQFAQEVRIEDVLALNSVRIDSNYVAQLARRYALTNAVSISSINYDLHKNPTSGPVWKATCFDAANRLVGWLTVDAGDGKVIEHGGFELPPVASNDFSGEPVTSRPAASWPAASEPAAPSLAAPQATTPESANSQPATSAPAAPAPPLESPEGGGFRRQANADPAGEEGRSVRPPRDIEVRRALPVEPERRRVVIDPFRPIRRLFPF